MSTLAMHLQRRGARYYFRKRLPWLYARILHRSHVVRSLRTSCPRQARRQASRLSARLEDAFESTEIMSEEENREPSRAELDQILMDIFTEILEVGELNRASRSTGYRAEPIEEEHTIPHQLLGMTNTEWHKARAELKLELNDLESAEETVESKLQQYRLRLPEDQVERKLFLRQVLATETAAHKVEIDREQGLYYRPEHPFIATAVPAGKHASPVSVSASRETLSQAYETFVQAKEKLRDYTDKTANQARYAISLWLDLMGDRPFAEVQRADAATFQTELAGIPSLSGRSIYKNKTPSEAARIRQALADKLEEDIDTITIEGKSLFREKAEEYAEPLSPKTINRHLGFLSEFYSWKIDRGAYSFQNPFQGIRYSKSQVRKHTNARQTWQLEELQTLFQFPIWTGYKNHRNRITPGNILPQDIRFWAPLISLHSGMREHEICGLECDHVIFSAEANNWLFYVYKGKTENAQRYVPIHPNLLELGLLDFIEWSKQQGQRRLFYKDAPYFTATHEAERVSDWFTNYRKSLGIYTKRVDFHSLRHNFKTTFQQQFRGDNSIVDSVMGHSGGNDVHTAYFHGYRAKDVSDAVKSLDFELDFTPIKESQATRIPMLEAPQKPPPNKKKGKDSS
ncbi:site-specific integrase [Fodinicurvata fenggangensis]|uniref:site-specific integrase n=1 Tax=Fodinicurvata fenggangensis TaxID=1121830 RepID=UPI00138E1FF8|nr:site-specific integrase [Fodinicurvata fenggangensis]